MYVTLSLCYKTQLNRTIKFHVRFLQSLAVKDNIQKVPKIQVEMTDQEIKRQHQKHNYE